MGYRYFLVILFICGFAYAQSDLDHPSSTADYRSGFFGADYRNISQDAYDDWIVGDYFQQVRQGVEARVTTWEAMTQFQRWRVRLHHQSLVKYEHINIPKVWVYYYTGIPASKKDQIKLALTPDEFEFLGNTFAAAKAKLNARAANLANKFWVGKPPHIAEGEPDEVVGGWEADFGL